MALDTTPQTTRRVDELCYVFDAHLERLHLDTARPEGAAVAVAMLCTALAHDGFWDDLADEAAHVFRHDIVACPAELRWAVIGRYSGLRDAAIDAEVSAWDVLEEGAF